ncbi:glycosyltransferase family 2 protein [Sulfitobacter mediterraneus]|jgi:GT2 family glycosyltransferase|uniref:GT2 family glycosyltransferase n=1 Tax=Sulfitobacter mediterraneus TaxID=83219 RepID=A0A2T6CC77_9RHOB|nr:glycosyltransferase [Sulfitobacter mediterraneus]KIN77942.1 Glycosyl transferase, family 2 [Sulfitobacter mediterraneus KCTC 32188]PTX73107.1 GT2 family glycosyltransferase [Sulfitobacter mediterraneus]
MTVAAVVIGRNEGARLIACLAALEGQVDQVIYVDSGSTDGSAEAAQSRGALVVALDMTQPFTAARARNAGLEKVAEGVEFVQFLDGDCALRKGWIDTARSFLEGHPDVAVVCGRRRERFPDASVYNRLIDREWDTPVGQALACGGDALMRVAPLRDLGGYRDSLIAGEEPELCVRLRQAGWQIWRLDAEMTWHDAEITRLSQWWKRSQRAGHAFAEGAALHGAPPERHWVAESRRALIWGAVLPLSILLLALLISPWALLLLGIYPLQILRLSRHGGLAWAALTTFSKFAEGLGVVQYHLRRMSGRKSEIIEYK